MAGAEYIMGGASTSQSSLPPSCRTDTDGKPRVPLCLGGPGSPLPRCGSLGWEHVHGLVEALYPRYLCLQLAARETEAGCSGPQSRAGVLEWGGVGWGGTLEKARGPEGSCQGGLTLKSPPWPSYSDWKKRSGLGTGAHSLFHSL